MRLHILVYFIQTLTVLDHIVLKNVITKKLILHLIQSLHAKNKFRPIPNSFVAYNYVWCALTFTYQTNVMFNATSAWGFYFIFWAITHKYVSTKNIPSLLFANQFRTKVITA